MEKDGFAFLIDYFPLIWFTSTPKQAFPFSLLSKNFVAHLNFDMKGNEKAIL